MWPRVVQFETRQIELEVVRLDGAPSGSAARDARESIERSFIRAVFCRVSQ